MSVTEGETFMLAKKLMLLTVLVLISALSVAAQSTPIAGNWELTIVSPEGENKATMTVSQTEDKLSGLLKSAIGEYPLSGKISSRDVVLEFTIKYDGADMKIRLTGTAEGNAMKGAADFGGLAQGDWSAKKADTSSPTKGAATATEKINVSGKWQFEVSTSMGSGSPVITLQQEGEKLTGKYSGTLGEEAISGTIQGNELSFSFKASQFDGAVVTYKGKYEGGAMKGTMQLGDAASGTWTATRK